LGRVFVLRAALTGLHEADMGGVLLLSRATNTPQILEFRHGRAWPSEGRRRFDRLFPAIHVLSFSKKGVDARHKAGHDGTD
jgi:hypothetical protein